MASGTVSGRVVWSAPLTPVGIVASTVYHRTGAHVTTIDADGTTVFFFEDSGTKDALNRTVLDLDEVEPDSGGLGVLRLWPAAVSVFSPSTCTLSATRRPSTGATESRSARFRRRPRRRTSLRWSRRWPCRPASTSSSSSTGRTTMPSPLTSSCALRRRAELPVVLATSPDGTFDQSPPTPSE